MHHGSGKLAGLICVAFLLAALLVLNMRGIQQHLRVEGEGAPAAVSAEVPATLALTTQALGPLRGLIVDALWWRMIQHQDQGRYFETMQLTNWITALQPRYPEVWAFNAWNLSYNVAYEFADPASRWKWIDRSIRLLARDALTYNPDSAVIRKELARLFLDRIGSRLDTAQEILKRDWAEVMMTYLPNGSRQDIEALAEAQKLGEGVFELPPVARLVAAMESLGIDLRTPQTVLSRADWEGTAAALRDAADRAEAWRKLEAWTRATRIYDEYRLSPETMLFVDREYGEFDWRLPYAHAVYWAVAGTTFDEFLHHEDAQLSVFIRQAMEASFHNGKLLYEPNTGFFMTTNNLGMVGKIHDLYDTMIEERYTKAVDRLHKEFLEDAVAILYSFNQQHAARTMFGHLAEDYELPRGMATFEQFLASQMHRVVSATNYKDSRSLVHATLYQAYFWLAASDVQRARGYMRMAKLIYDRHQAKHATVQGKQLPVFDQMKQVAFKQMHDSDIAPFMRERLMAFGPGQGDVASSDAPDATIYLGGQAHGGHGLQKDRELDDSVE